MRQIIEVDISISFIIQSHCIVKMRIKKYPQYGATKGKIKCVIRIPMKLICIVHLLAPGNLLRWKASYTLRRHMWHLYSNELVPSMCFISRQQDVWKKYQRSCCKCKWFFRDGDETTCCSIRLPYAFKMRQDYLSTSYLDQKYLTSERSEMREIWIDPSNVCWDNPVSSLRHMVIFFSYLSLWKLIRMQ